MIYDRVLLNVYVYIPTISTLWQRQGSNDKVLLFCFFGGGGIDFQILMSMNALPSTATKKETFIEERKKI